MINVFALSNGWLFDDLKKEIALHGAVASETPIANASAYICIRSSEFHKTPNKRKTLVQIHDVKNKVPQGAGHVSFVHPYQKELSRYKGVHSIDPIGSREIPLKDVGNSPVIGFFCKEYGDVKGSRFFEKAVNIAKKECDFTVLMIGDRLEHIAHLGIYEKRPAEPDDYQRISAYITCSQSPMIPLSTYEALAGGREVISTPRQWIGGITNVRTVYTPRDMASAIKSHCNYLRAYTPIKPYCRTEWAKKQIMYASNL